MNRKTANSNYPLHLPDLNIRGFRGFSDITFPRLGRVTLIAGRNSVGKTTVLEAVRLFAARGRQPIVSSLLMSRRELSVSMDDDGNESLEPDLEFLFYGRENSECNAISIGPREGDSQLRISIVPPYDEFLTRLGFDNVDEDFMEDMGIFRTEFRGLTHEVPVTSSVMPRRRRTYFGSNFNYADPIICEFVGSDLSDDEFVARHWDRIALTDNEVRTVEALNLIFGDRVERVAVVGDHSIMRSRRVLVRMAGDDRPFPLRSLGDGAVRLFTIAVALAVSHNGLLLIDEAENGLHYSVLPDFWKMIIRTAQMSNVQVLATTHSADCIKGFEKAVSEVDAEELAGIVVRIQRDDGHLSVREYADSKLTVAAKQRIEMR